MPPANLSIAPLTPDEVPLYQNLRHETFRSTVNKILYTREPFQETQTRIIEKYKKELVDGTALFASCRDNDTRDMIAYAQWRYVGPKDGEEVVDSNGNKRPRDRTWTEVEEGLTIPAPYPESDPRVFEALFRTFNQGKRDILGARPYYVLNTLVTHPSHHRRGAGGLLVQWVCEQADKKGVEAYLEATPMGMSLYERHGFQRIKTVSIDMREFGGDEKFDFILMRRPAKGEKPEEGISY